MEQIKDLLGDAFPIKENPHAAETTQGKAITEEHSTSNREPITGQLALIAGILRKNGRISTEDAGRAGILAKSLSARICDLREREWVIHTDITPQDAGYGIKKPLPLYILKEIPLFDLAGSYGR
ncbi:MAG: hypothetical protein IKI30_02660 [Oxalobacter sp.]|nr:hypothetical protein [Oxalobacter sp.]